jgi:hypothetical protein
MTQDNIQQDTPQEGANTEQYSSLEEAVFGTSEGSEGDITSAFTSGNEGNTETAPEGQPEVSTQENVQQPTQPNNDEKRYQYWQSQADKYKNELNAMKQAQQQPAQEQHAQQQPQEPVQQPAEQFPAPPQKPQRPRTFNREEAYSDPSSDSARYLDELEGWRDDINEYNTLKSEYQTALVEERFNSYEQQRVAEAQRQQAAQQKAVQENEIKSHVMGHYGMQESEAVDFMSKMSDPSSITIDNLVQLYRLQGSGNAEGTQAPAAPSQQFTQTKNAQQVPSPMGVMPSGQSNVDGRTTEDKIMDKMIGNFNSKNPWK